MTLLGDRGLDTTRFDAEPAQAIGEGGATLLASATAHGRPRVEERDWLYCLASTPGTRAHRAFVLAPGKRADAFVRAIESAFDPPEGDDLPPTELTRATVAPGVLELLRRAEAHAAQGGRISDAGLTLALVETAPPLLREMLASWLTPERLGRFQSQLRAELARPGKDEGVFKPDGTLDARRLDASGRRLCRRLAEDAASLGVTRLTTRHMLYSLLGEESGPLAVALAARGLDVKNDLHARLSRELARPGRRRGEEFVLNQETMHEAAADVLRRAPMLARERGAEAAGAFDVHRAFVLRQFPELRRLVPPERSLDEATFRSHLDSLDPLDDDPVDPDASPALSMAEIETRIKDRICGQDAAVDRVLPWVKRLRFGLPRDDRPAAVFLFLGPTGTGKTQLAKELARHVFGDESMLIFLEMGQFQEQHAMSIFVGAPPGYIGYGEGKLTNGLRDRPESVVLFDEIEKADVRVFDAVLRFADEGLISDPAGPVRDGRKCLIVLTTNAGQRWLRDHLREHPGDLHRPEFLADRLFQEAMDEMTREKNFRPEFLGRVDERVTFLPFAEETVQRIVRQVLCREAGRFSSLKGVELNIDDNVYQSIAARVAGRALEEGARAVPRAVNEEVVTKVIDALIARGHDPERDPPLSLSVRLGVGETVEVVDPGRARRR